MGPGEEGTPRMSASVAGSIVLPGVGFMVGFATAAGLCLRWRVQDLRLRRLAMGYAASSLLAAITRLEEHLPIDGALNREAAGVRELAAAVAKLAGH